MKIMQLTSECFLMLLYRIRMIYLNIFSLIIDALWGENR